MLHFWLMAHGTYGRSQGDRNGNPNPGLVVDRELVNSTFVDFYLQSHHALQGTTAVCVFGLCISFLRRDGQADALLPHL